MAGRGSPLGLGSPRFPSINIRSMMTGDGLEENQIRNEEPGYSGYLKTVNPGTGAHSEKSKAKSRTGNDLHSHTSHSSHVQSAIAEYEMAEELLQLEEEEEDLRLKMSNIDTEIEWMKKEISCCQQQLEEESSMTKTEAKSYKQKLLELEQQLRNLMRKLQSNEEVSGMKVIKKKTVRIQARADMKKIIIVDENEQFIGSDEEIEQIVVPNSEPNFNRIEDFVNSSIVETRKQNKALAEETISVDIKKAEEKAKLEVEVQDIEKRIQEQSAKLKEAQRRQKEVQIQQDESDRLIAEELQKKLDLEAQLLKVKMESVSIPEETKSSLTPSAAGKKRLVQLFAEAIRGSVSNNNLPDNGKFLARQSYSKDLPLFSGKAEEWPIFFADFERSTKDCGFSNSENMSRLRKCLKGDAARFVQSLMVSPDNVPTVMKKLEIRYGQPELIIEAMISKAKCVPTFKDQQLELFIEFGSAVQNVIATIKTLKRPGHLSNPQLLKEFEVKLPRNYMMQWLNWITVDSERKRDLVNFSDWIDGQTVLACQACPPSNTQDTPSILINKNKPENQRPVRKKVNFVGKNIDDLPTAAGLFVGENFKRNDWPKCIFCEKHVDSTACSKAQDWTLAEKTKIIKEKKACDLCLKIGHWRKECKAFVRCMVCKKKHCTLMCPDIHKSELPPKEPQQQGASIPATDKVLTISDNLACASKVLLKTLLVNIVSKCGNRAVRTILDDGSQRSYIFKKLAYDLDLTGHEDLGHVLFSGVHTDIQKHKRYEVQLKNAQGPGYSIIEVLDQEKICGFIPRQTRGPWLRELKDNNIWICDIGDDCPEIEMLIGADVLGKLLTGNVRQLKNGLTAVETVLGWTLMGKTNSDGNEGSLAMTVNSMLVADASVAQLWDLEVIGIRDPIEKLSKLDHEEVARRHFLETVSRSEDGRYSVSLPWIDGRIKLPDNQRIAEKRLESTTKRLLSMNKYNEYDKIFKDWCLENIIEEVPPEEIDREAHYIPHRAVLKPESLTTPLRPVFDASCKAPRTPSLNQCLEKGPNLLELIPCIILKVREKKIGLIADIRKAFQMIEVLLQDRDFLRFLW